MPSGASVRAAWPAGLPARRPAGLPASAALAVVVVGLLAALQVLAGAWLGRAAIPRRAAS